MILLHQALKDHLPVCRQRGFQLNGDARLLENFVGFLEQPVL